MFGGLWFWKGRLASDTLGRVREAGMIRIGYAVEAPYAYLTPEGKVTGESPEIAALMAGRLGIPRVEWRLTEFSELLGGLEAGEFDVIAAGMFITPERQQRVAFSRPVFRVSPGLLVRKGNPHGLHSYADLIRQTATRIAVLSGAAEEELLLGMGFPETRLIRVPDALSGRVAVRSGRADGLVLSAPTIRWMVMNPIAGLTEMAEPFEAATGGDARWPAFGGFVFRKSDRALREAWDVELARFVGTEEHLRLVRSFGFTAAEVPLAGDVLMIPPQP
ncbi:MAG: ectoine/hydroxyectoine ABC transporter substrate-binding protein EhuB [Verrucomicrobiales bacterium]|nr:ectoine/hydroxyectoine ABC transporter substrate-binding protein EhuB [Verrucomicrobiales bacterium]